ncbi:LppU/SCO3897 family protein [Streptacidiphilus cavernicola]|uniref:Uncharacterized protein n=1 Tax=Streptacidiphilus cavernicola TaxID=3342716 RepID=A0ABV6W4L5_9ACTN
MSTPPPSYGTPPNPYQGQQPPNPYAGQQQTQQPPYSQPQVPQPQFAQYPVAAAQPTKRRRSLLIRLAVIVVGLIVVGGGSYIYDHMTGAADTAKAGDCVQNKGTESNPDVKVIGCTDPKAEFKVLKTLSGSNMDDCNSVPGLVAAYSQSGGRGSDLVLCLGKNTP